tara:strand:- start:8915 stop:9910 length:996 start_codon:yes stop_codon:yes gene_type:complete
MANAFKRTTGSIDRQWRNIAAVDKGKEGYNIGRLVKEAVQDYKNLPDRAKEAARSITLENGWGLDELIYGKEAPKKVRVRQSAAAVRDPEKQSSMNRKQWSQQHLSIIHGLFYVRGQREADRFYEEVAAMLGRPGGDAVKSQFTHFQNGVRHPKKNITKKIRDLTQKKLDDPISVVLKAIECAKDLGQKALDWFPGPEDLDHKSFSSTCLDDDDHWRDAILFKLIWDKPRFALLKESKTTVFQDLGKEMSVDHLALRKRARTLYAIINNIELGKKCLDKQRLSTFSNELPVKNELPGRLPGEKHWRAVCDKADRLIREVSHEEDWVLGHLL